MSDRFDGLKSAVAGSHEFQSMISHTLQDSGAFFMTQLFVGFIAVFMIAIWLTRAYRAASRTARWEQKKKLTMALDNMCQGLCLFDHECKLLLCNATYIRMYGLSPDKVKPGCSFRDLIALRAEAGMFVGDQSKYIEAVLDGITKGRKVENHVELGDGRVINIIGQPIEGGGWIATHEDVTGRRRAEQDRDNSKILLDAVIESVPATIFVKRATDGRYCLINRAGETFYGVRREQMIGKTAQEVFSGRTAQILTGLDRKVKLDGGKAVEEREIELNLPGNRIRIANTTRIPLFDRNGGIEYILGVVEDVTERRQSEIRLAHMTRHDPLTNLPNRSAFSERLSEALADARRDQQRVALLCIDLNRFKRCNDLFGFSTGDLVMREIARRLREAAGNAFLARYGGDKFVLIQTEAALPAGAEQLAVRLLQASGEETWVDDCPVRIGASIGISIYPDDGTDSQLLLENAEAALQRAKSSPGPAVRFFKPETDFVAHDQKVLRHDLHYAVSRNEFRLYYQPQARIDGAMTGFEALVRWQHPVRGLIGPADFIGLAEDAGLMGELGEWVLREACREAASWSRPLQISVNLSPTQFRSGDLPALIRSTLLESGLRPDRLELEITEGTLIDDLAGATALLWQIKAQGVRIAMDDFGTGYSSLSYLQSFPFDKIKIDRAFIAHLEHNPQSAAIVRAVVGLGHGLGLRVLAEGVETHEQLVFLRREQCDEIQGHLIGKAAPISEYSEFAGAAAEHVLPANVAVRHAASGAIALASSSNGLL